MTIVSAPTAFGPAGERLVPARVAGVEFRVSCPKGCDVDHFVGNPHCIEDLHHVTPPVSAVVPGVNGPTPVLTGHVAQSPFAVDPAHQKPTFVFAPTHDDPVELGRAAALAALDQLSAHIDALRSVVEKMPKEVAA